MTDIITSADGPDELYGEPIEAIQGVGSDVVTILVGESEPYQSIRISGERLSVYHGPEFEQMQGYQSVDG